MIFILTVGSQSDSTVFNSAKKRITKWSIQDRISIQSLINHSLKIVFFVFLYFLCIIKL